MQKVAVLRTELLSPSVAGIELACVPAAPFSFVPGQWIDLHVRGDGQSEKRPYSIASAPNPAHPERFELAVTRVEGGQVSALLHGLEVGDALEIDGPHGFFTREDHKDEVTLLVGTGTGVAPLRAMLQAELARPAGPQIALLFGCRTEADLLYGQELQQLAATHPRFRFEPTLSRADTAWAGRRGYVQAHLGELVTDLQRPHVYVCGLSNMVNEVRSILKTNLGYDRKHIHSERYD